MRWMLAAVILVGCGSSAAQRDHRTLPEPVVQLELPEEVERPEGGVRTQPVAYCVTDVALAEAERLREQESTQADLEDREPEHTEPDHTDAGVLFSLESAAYVGRLRVEYDRTRDLYGVDQTTWGHERQVYQRTLDLGDQEIERANERAERTWWEKHGDEVGMIGGFVLGVAVTVGIVAAVDATRSGI